MKGIISDSDGGEVVLEVLGCSVPEVVPVISEPSFFDCFSLALEKNVYFYDTILVLHSPLNNVFNVNSIYLHEYSLNCCFYTHWDITLDGSSTCPTISDSGDVYPASRMVDIHLLCSIFKDGFSVIFVYGARVLIYLLITMTLWVLLKLLRVMEGGGGGTSVTC